MPGVAWKTLETGLMHSTLITTHWLFLVRTWLLYYDIRCNQQIQDAKWRGKINPSESEKWWFINNRARFGSARNISALCCFICITLGVISSLYVFVEGDVNFTSNFLVVLNAALPMTANV